MRSIPEFIDKLGGATAVAGLLGLPATTVASWKARDSIPVEHWPRLIGAGQEAGIAECNYALLVKLHVPDQAEPAA